MADECCDTVIGGRVEIRVEPAANQIGPTLLLQGMGDARIQPTQAERSAGSTNNGKLWVTTAPRPARVMMDYANMCDHDPWVLIKANTCKLHVTVREIDRRIRHRFSNAAVVGFAEINLSTGIISGLEIVADKYERESIQ